MKERIPAATFNYFQTTISQFALSESPLLEFLFQRACSCGYEIDPNGSDRISALPDSTSALITSSSESRVSSKFARSSISITPSIRSAAHCTRNLKFGLSRGICLRCGSLPDANALRSDVVPALGPARRRQLKREARHFLKCPTDASPELIRRLKNLLALSVPRLKLTCGRCGAREVHPLGESGFASGSLTDRLQRLLDRKARSSSSLRLSAAPLLTTTPNSSCRGHRTPFRPKGVDLGALLRNTPATAQLQTTPAFRESSKMNKWKSVAPSPLATPSAAGAGAGSARKRRTLADRLLLDEDASSQPAAGLFLRNSTPPAGAHVITAIPAYRSGIRGQKPEAAASALSRFLLPSPLSPSIFHK